MAAVAGDAENINKQARKTRTNWLKSPERANWVNDGKNKQAADVLSYLRPQWGAPTKRPRRLALRTGPSSSTLHVRIISSPQSLSWDHLSCERVGA
eukprot:CAMPEP_0196679730 /NCGR_PEP_ID=MMETSP1090-20130531/7295_1 /TAXON_ID=37098 /ORGANISM="Isochrysis sp, Strain CCMP1244" /LENGTH=95 /DNA_ID=CAMNT_0042017995 /DNA_START=67 /DNA_END=351 /DNA_ORIENTATION=-